MKITWDKDGKWAEDESGNRASVTFFGSKAAAEMALASLSLCRNCVNCSDCSRCSDCSDCSYCSRCSDCSGCSRCSDCSRCSRCSDCSGCSYCSYCSDRHGTKDANGSALKVPVVENLHQKVFAAASQEGALEMGNWHTCETTYCRAGWIVFLAGDEGRKLEKHHDTPLAAMLIARESGAPINPARFYDSNEDALADMKRMADV